MIDEGKIKVNIFVICCSIFLVCTALTNADNFDYLKGVRSGDILRVKADSLGPVCGKFLKVTPDTLSLGPYPFHQEQRHRVRKNYKPINTLLEFRPLSDSVSIDMKLVTLVSRRKNKAGTGAVIGGGLGAGVMLVFATVTLTKSEKFKDGTKQHVQAGIVGGLLGAGLGALVGSIFPKWDVIYKR